MPALLETTDVFVEGDTLYEAMHEDIARASDNSRLECYILADDEIGSPMLNALHWRAPGKMVITLDLCHAHRSSSADTPPSTPRHRVLPQR